MIRQTISKLDEMAFGSRVTDEKSVFFKGGWRVVDGGVGTARVYTGSFNAQPKLESHRTKRDAWCARRQAKQCCARALSANGPFLSGQPPTEQVMPSLLSGTFWTSITPLHI